jgi:RNA polymerase subunit RPABC4/transcription elongation factor Spt4
MRLGSLIRACIFCGVLTAAAGLILVTMLLSGGVTADQFVILFLAGVCGLSGLLMMAFLCLYVYYDAASRGMKGALWAFLIFFFASLPGFLVYLLMRTPRLRACVVCGTPIHDDYVVCPTCQTRVGLGCPHCHRRVEPDWVVCPYCQHDLAPAGHAAEQGAARDAAQRNP